MRGYASSEGVDCVPGVGGRCARRRSVNNSYGIVEAGLFA